MPTDAVQRLAVLGAGVMGQGIVLSGALSGFRVSVLDTAPEYLDRALSHIKRELEQGVRRERFSKDQAAAALQAIIPTTDLAEAVVPADFVVEAVPEDLRLKHDTLRRVEEVTPAGVVLATNTSALSITEIAAGVANPSRVCGMHFFNPPHKMKLVEVIRGLETSDATISTTLQVARQMGKEPVEVSDFPGFAVSRINAMIGNEAFYMLMEGVASAEAIDKALKLGLHHPMGPFELGDMVGWDTRLSVLQYLSRTLGDKFRPCPLMIKYVMAGRLGRKVGQGVYKYDREGNRV